jgi:mono/diheme cytochrome c family protein
MRPLRTMAVIAILMLVASSLALAAHYTPVDRGKALFNDPKLGNGTAGKSCNTCHPDGKGLEGIGSKKEWKTPGGTFRTIEQAVNICIEMALKGKALNVKSRQMKDLVSYLMSLKSKGAVAPAKKPAVGC